MPSSAISDLLEASDKPTVAKDPARDQAVADEFAKRRSFLKWNYQFALQSLQGDKAFNRSLARLKRSLARKRPAKHRGVRAHPELEIAISVFARRHAAKRTGDPKAEVTQQDANAAADQASKLLLPRRGRPRNSILRIHVEALMAAIEEAVGTRVHIPLQKDNVYDPQAVDPWGQLLVDFFCELDPAITVTTLASIVKDARRKYAGRPMRFRDLLPIPDVPEFDENGVARRIPGDLMAAFVPSIPIYFP